MGMSSASIRMYVHIPDTSIVIITFSDEGSKRDS